MLVICNGGMKSGSTWITQIVRESGKYKSIDEKYQNLSWRNPSIDEGKLEQLLVDVDYLKGNLFCKQHWSGKEAHKQLLNNSNVKVLNIVRDIRDVFVSRYFHDLRVKDTESETISDYYWNDNGRKKIMDYMEYQIFWHQTDGVQPHLSCYENLIEDPISGIKSIFEYLEQDLSEENIQDISNKTQFDSNKNTGDGKFLRKGIKGDWVNYLDKKMLDDINAMCMEFSFFECFPQYNQDR